jgi:hypothetical protein
MENSLTLTVKNALPQLAGSITYNDVPKMFLTPGYVSQAGNMYQEGVRLSRRMAVKFSIGHGYAHSFLNGIQVYVWDGSKPKMVAQRTYSNFWWSERDTNLAVKDVVKEYLINESKVQGVNGISDKDFDKIASDLVGDALQTTVMLGNQVLTSNNVLQLKG